MVGKELLYIKYICKYLPLDAVCDKVNIESFQCHLELTVTVEFINTTVALLESLNLK